MDNCGLAYDLGCFNSCEDICLPIISDTTCVFNIEFYRRGSLVRVPVAVRGQQYIKIPSGLLNEYTNRLCFKIYYPDGTVVGTEVDGELYTEFAIKVSPLVIIKEEKTPYFCITEDCGSYKCIIKDY